MSVVNEINVEWDSSVRPLTEEEKQLFAKLIANGGRRFLAAEPDQAINLIEGSEVFAGTKLQAVPPDEHTLVPQLEPSRRLVPVLNLEQSHQAATSVHRRNPNTVLQFVLPPLVFAIVFVLVLNFYPPSHSSLQSSINLTDPIKPSDSDLSQIVTATPDFASQTTTASVRNIPVQTKVEVVPQAQEPAKAELDVQAPPQVSNKIEPTIRKTSAQATSMKKQGPQRSAQLTQPVWLAGPAWSRNSESFINYLFFGH
jgi:hypothetical protein